MSVDLDSLREGAWPLDDLVERANDLLPELLPKDAGKRAAEPVNQRLVRHYATQGLLDEPLKEGREARYLFRHLLQLLVVRRLLAEGFTAAVVGQVLKDRSDDELRGLLTGRLQIEVVPREAPSDARVQFLQQVRERAGLEPESPDVAGTPAPRPVPSPTASPPRGNAASPPTTIPANPFHDSTWSHVTIMDGLQLLVRDDFRLPETRLGDAELAQLLKVTLLYLEQKQRGKP